MNRLYRISDVARLMGVNPKTLRYYEEQKILVPSVVDSHSGYRYYNEEAILFLWQILVMRDSGMGMQEIRTVIEEKGIGEQIEKLERRLIALQTTLSLLQQMESPDTTYQVVENSLPGGLYLRHRLVAKDSDEIFDAFMDLFDLAQRRNLPVDRKRPPFARFTDIVFQHENIHVQVYLPVQSTDYGGDVVRVQVPRAVSVVHRGDYSRVEEAYNVLEDYIREHDLDMIDSPMEFYIFGMKDPERKRMSTTVFFPIA